MAPLRRFGLYIAASSAACYTGLDADRPDAAADDSSDGGALSSSDEGGSDSTGASSEDPDARCEPGAPRVWRLTARQLDASIDDLFSFAADTRWTDGLPADRQSYNFANNSDALQVDTAFALELSRVAEAIAAQAFGDPAQHLQPLWPCALAELELDAPASACIEGFVQELGRRAYRRPLTQPELDAYLGVVTAASTPRRGLELVVIAVLQSPNFLYRTELLSGAMTAHEAVSLLAFTLWDRAPDEALLDRADAGIAPGDYEALVDDMLADPRAREVYTRFFVDWLDLEAVAATDKPEDPRDSAELRAAIVDDLRSFVEHVMFDGSGTQREIFTSNETVYDSRLAPIYGDVQPATDGIVAHDPGERVGLLTSPAWLLSYAEPQRPTPIARGFQVRTRLLCQPMPPIPPGVDPTVPPPVPGETTRERYSRHASDPQCAGCHNLMDPVGFMFSSYDPLGGFVTVEQGQPVDASGEMHGTTFDGAYGSAAEMLPRLAESRELTGCLPQQLYTFVHGQTAEVRDDACSADAAADEYAQRDGDIRALLHTLLTRRIAIASAEGNDP
ncbi:MAG TPA: DUF1588 domain-containing protein [Nannocystaceae bacterium]|nr:DUF1588 domain-containing protein [Nannocystaceae bacterium]